MTKRRLWMISTFMILSGSLAYGQNCSAQRIKQLQGVWINKDRTDTALLMIKNEKLEFNFKGSRNWDEAHTIYISNKIPQIPDSISDGGFMEAVSTYDTLHYKILRLTDTSLSLMKYSIGKHTFFDAGEKPVKHIERTVEHYRKTKGLPAGYNLKESVFGIWRDEATHLVLKPDSTFSMTFSNSNDVVYSTCGKFRYNGDMFILKDQRDKTQAMDPLDCGPLRTTSIESNPVLFDKANEIHLHYSWLGLWLKETHMILTKMR